MSRNASAVLTQTGWLYLADATAGAEAAPAAAVPDPSTDPAGNWDNAGYTDDGVSFEWDVTTEQVFVAEEFAAIRTLWTEVEYRIAAVLAQFEMRTLQFALNGGTITPVVGPPVENTYAPPTPGNDHPWSVLFRFYNEYGFGSDLYAQLARNTESTSIPFTKAPQKSVIGLELTLETPSTGNIWDLREYVSAS